MPTQSQQVAKATHYIQRVNPDLDQNDARKIVSVTMKWASEFKLDPALLLSIQTVESRFRQHAISSSGAMGLMQFIPYWHLDKMKTVVQSKQIANPDVFDMDSNIYIGSWVMRDCMNVQKDVNKALLCYNGSLKNPNGYDDKVLRVYENLKQQIRI